MIDDHDSESIRVRAMRNPFFLFIKFYRMSSTQQLILRVTEELAQQIRAVVERHNDVAEQTPLVVEIEPENESGIDFYSNLVKSSLQKN